MVAIAYLVFKTATLAAEPGYDFRYLWVAGRMWLDGLNPYEPQYQQVGAALISQGHVPLQWVYPPSWWLICTPLGLLDLKHANVAWNVLNIILLIAGSLLITRSYRAAFPDEKVVLPGLGDLLAGRVDATAAHLLVMAALQATMLVFAAGQTSILIYFGVAAVLYGLTTNARWWTVIGLVIVFLKPQIGLILAASVFFHGSLLRREIITAAIISALLATPALLADPGSPLAFVRSVATYDAMTAANLPQAMTGLRLVVWELAHLDIGNMAAAAITAGAAVAVGLGPLRPADGAPLAVRGWQLISLAVGLTAALGPLHYYDFVLIGTLLFPMLAARAAWRWAGIVGVVLIFRADDLGKATGLYDPQVPIFEGSILSTVGAFLMCAALWSAIRYWRSLPATRA